VQEAAASAGSLQDQARRLTEVVAVFKLNNHEVIDVTQAQREQEQALPQGRMTGGALPGLEVTAGALSRS